MRHFTVEEANAALPRVRALAERMVAAFHRGRALRAELSTAEQAARGNGTMGEAARAEALHAEMAVAAQEVSRAVEELGRVGVQVKDLGLGLIDFPTRHPDHGQTVLLCWRLGEDEIRYWHGLEEGYAGRKPLPF